MLSIMGFILKFIVKALIDWGVSILSGLFHSHRLSKVTRLVDVCTLDQSYVIGQQL